MSESPSPDGGAEAALEAADDAIAFRLRGWTKIYPGTVALEDVDLDLQKGEVHGLCGGNGSGKSTLIKVLCGVVPGDGGTLEAADRTIEVAQLRPKLVHSLGIRVVHQDLAQFPDLTVAENMTLGSDVPTGLMGRYDWQTARRVTQEQLDRFEVSARPGELLK